MLCNRQEEERSKFFSKDLRTREHRDPPLFLERGHVDAGRPGGGAGGRQLFTYANFPPQKFRLNAKFLTDGPPYLGLLPKRRRRIKIRLSKRFSDVLDGYLAESSD